VILVAHLEVSTFHKEFKQDLAKMQEVLAMQIKNIQAILSSALANMAKTLADTKELTKTTKEIASTVGKVNNATNKIATTTQSYSDTLKHSLAAIVKHSLNPKVLGDMECKAQQILIDIFNKEDSITCSKSMTKVIIRMNETLKKMENTNKLTKVHIESALQTYKGALVLTLNSKEAVTWIGQPEIEMAFTEAFSKGLHIRERIFNLITPRVLIIFELENDNHLRELEEVNGLREFTICKAHWMPTIRRRMGQTHAYTILSITSTEYANILIRDGLIICATRVRPTKQKFKPIQCMKCRKWGHIVGECLASGDICSICRGQHYTNAC